MKYDFTSILNRDGMDAIAVNPPMNASWISFAPIKEGFDLIPMWVADMNFPTVPTIQDAIIERTKHPLSDISAHVLNILNPLSTGIS